jgi:L-lactate dehydrogenase complex protein LldE
MASAHPDVGLFVTCLVDLMRPSVGFAAVKLLEDAGCRVTVPVSQTCCGQPAYNAGDSAGARAIAANVIEAFAGFDYVVAPSASCAAMIKVHYPLLLEGKDGLRARALAGRTHELVSFLTDVLHVEDTGAAYRGVATYHDSCSSLREMEVRDQPRRLLARVAGLTLKETEEADSCCGFGGLFSVKHSEISGHMVDAKVNRVTATGADTLLGADLGCLLNMAGRLKRRGSAISVRHVAEVLAALTETPPIGEGAGEEEADAGHKP